MVQLFFLLFFVSYLFAHIADIGTPGIFYYGAFIFIYVYAMTELMDNNKQAWVWELIKLTFGICLLYCNSGWFDANQYFFAADFGVFVYLCLSFVMSILLTARSGSLKSA
jgi:hypothetical protein